MITPSTTNPNSATQSKTSRVVSRESLPLNTLLFHDPAFNLGLAAIAISATVFTLTDIFSETQRSSEGIFLVNYVVAVIYGIYLLSTRRSRRERASGFDHPLLFCVLAYISAFALNRTLPVFQRSADWLCAAVVLQCAVLVLVSYRRYAPLWIQRPLYMLAGAAALLNLYYAVYLVPLYGFGAIGLVAIGLGAHTFVPLFTSFRLYRHLRAAFKEESRLVTPFMLGAALPLVFVSLFVARWSQLKQATAFAANEGLVENSELPRWVRVSQRMPNGWIAERLLKTDIVYGVPDPDRWFSNMGFPSLRFDGDRYHDPLVVVSVLFGGKLNLSDDERINVLEAMHDARHQAQERLWAGENLTTSSVASNVRVFPQYRMAYTEKTLTIKNSTSRTWNNSQEALYTIYLPEGGVVTSLSLWVFGKEEKGILTSKAKADTAYKTIVGVESRAAVRDPSVVHWQEGNTVTVRVFPCLPDEERIVKIGVTAPLKKSGDRLVYENIYFDGPAASDKTPEMLKLAFDQQPEDLKLQLDGFETDGTSLTLQRGYEPYWEASFAAPPLSTEPFVFNGKSYGISEYTKTYEPFTPGAVFLDLNASWTKSELNDVWKAVQHYDVYAILTEPVKLTNDNLDAVFKKSQGFNYSLFPFHQTRVTHNALVITKSNRRSANLDDINNSGFLNDLKHFFRKPRNVNVYNIGEETAPYIKSLKEMRVFGYDSGSTSDLARLMEEKKFVKQSESDDAVVVERAGIQLLRQNVSENADVVAAGPDHLMRLFAYNSVMRILGSGLLVNENDNGAAVDVAEEAYVVTPMSSLVVLETQADYDRFDIKEPENSLRNASTKSSGAVPEPHEWLLMIAFQLFVLYFVFNPLKRNA